MDFKTRNPDDDKNYLEDNNLPYSVLIEKLDINDPHYNEWKRKLPKDKAHFDHIEVFKKIQQARDERQEIEDFYGIIPMKTQEDMIEHMRIATGE